MRQRPQHRTSRSGARREGGRKILRLRSGGYCRLLLQCATLVMAAAAAAGSGRTPVQTLTMMMGRRPPSTRAGGRVLPLGAVTSSGTSTCRRKGLSSPSSFGFIPPSSALRPPFQAAAAASAAVEQWATPTTTISITTTTKRAISSTPPLRLNRLLFEPEEVVATEQQQQQQQQQQQEGRGVEDAMAVVRIPKDDARARHVRKILRAQSGDCVRVGVLNRGRHDEAPIEWEADGSLRIALGPISSLLRSPSEKERPRVDVLLAMQAPLRMERIIPHIVALGVGRLLITSAKKVEKSYWGSHLLREPTALRDLVIEGLSQAGDTIVPDIIVNRRIKRFLEDDLEALYPSSPTSAHASSFQPTLRVISHPFRALPDSPAVDTRFRHLTLPQGGMEGGKEGGRQRPRLLLAIGPESGWDEPYELDLFRQHGFQQVTLGPRVLRTEAAVPALVALAHDRLHALDEQWEREAAQAETSSLARRGGSVATTADRDSALKQP